MNNPYMYADGSRKEGVGMGMVLGVAAAGGGYYQTKHWARRAGGDSFHGGGHNVTGVFGRADKKIDIAGGSTNQTLESFMEQEGFKDGAYDSQDVRNTVRRNLQQADSATVAAHNKVNPKASHIKVMDEKALNAATDSSLSSMSSALDAVDTELGYETGPRGDRRVNTGWKDAFTKNKSHAAFFGSKTRSMATFAASAAIGGVLGGILDSPMS